MTSLRDAIRAVGFEPPNNIIAGQTVRFSTNGKSGDKAGWVYLFGDEQGAAFGCNRSGERHTWQAARDRPFNEAEQAAFKRKIIECKKASIADKEASYKQAAATTRTEWDAAALAPASNAYLVRKGIGANMARVDAHGNLLISVYGLDGQMQSMQRITPGGTKRFVKGGKMRGGHAWIGEPENGATLLLSEGLATADTLHRATGHAVCICFSAGNLRHVAEMVRKKYPKATLIIAGDNDTKTEGNPGRTKATEAALAVAGTAVFPDSGDFNDLEQSEGLDAVRRHFELIQLPVVHVAFDTPALSGTDSRDGTDSTRPLSELGNAARLIDAHGGSIHYVHNARAWLHWRGGAWNWDVDGAALAESLIKSLVSGDTMTVRKLYTAPVQFTPQFKLMMLGNHKPIIKGNDHGIWRRVRLIPFNRTFKPEERDAGLTDKLKAEAPHILAWMVEGCMDWQKHGLSDTPKTIKDATGSYQEEQDLIGNWLSECCDLSPMNEAPSTEIYARYKNWCMDNGLKPSSSVALGRRLGERGFIGRRSNGVTRWAGIAVLPSPTATYSSCY